GWDVYESTNVVGTLGGLKRPGCGLNIYTSSQGKDEIALRSGTRRSQMQEMMLDTSFVLATGAVILILILTVDYLFQKGRKKQRS
ncbi:MAG: hypothetical protein MUP21_09105, partial [Dehalococcoidia bacterium]|nr:hypothetical protein [Dehalococcoidia bacterium]